MSLSCVFGATEEVERLELKTEVEGDLKRQSKTKRGKRTGVVLPSKTAHSSTVVGIIILLCPFNSRLLYFFAVLVSHERGLGQRKLGSM